MLGMCVYFSVSTLCVDKGMCCKMRQPATLLCAVDSRFGADITERLCLRLHLADFYSVQLTLNILCTPYACV